MAAIFLSHSSEDNAQAARLKGWLGEIGFEEVFLDFDKHRGIPLGSDWESRLYREMERCQAVLLVLTRNWLESKWCFAEFAQARALGKTIFVVIETPKGETAIAGDIQVCDLVADPEGGRERLRLALEEALLAAQGMFSLPRGRAPYPGLVSFEAADAAVFFGRDDEIKRIFEWVKSERSRQKKALVLLGGSGTGKSSLLKAGALPRLDRERDADGAPTFLVVPPVWPGDNPMRELLAALRRVDASLTIEALTAATTPAAARNLIERLRAAKGAHQALVVLAIDQAEELSAAADKEQAAAFALVLAALAAGDNPVRLLFALRADHLEDLQQIKGLADAIELFPVKPMPIERLSDIIEGPARRVDLLVEHRLVEAIKTDAVTADALPLVAFVLRELWDRHGEQAKRLERVHYEAMRQGELSPLEAAVRQKAEETIAGAAPTDLALLREAFVPGLVRVNEAGSFAKRPASRAALPQAALPLVGKLVDARLLVESDDRPGGRIEVAHEALFRVWPTLAGWLAEERDFLVGKSRIERLFEDYQGLPERQRGGGLLSGILLERARRWLERTPGRFTAEEAAFIRRSARRATRRARIERGLFVAALVLALGLAGSGLWAWQQRDAAVAARHEAEKQATRAERDVTAAKQAIDYLIFDIAQGLRNMAGMPVATIRRVLETVKATIDNLAASEPGDIGLKRSRLAMLVNFADIYLRAGDLKDAAASAEESLAIARDLAKDKGNAEAQRDLSVDLNKIGDVKLRAGDTKGALAAYEESLKIRRDLAKDKGDAQAQRDLSVSLEKIGDVKLQAGDTKGALAAYEEELAFARRYASDKGNADAQRFLLVVLNKIGDVKLQAGDREGALAAYEESLKIARELAKDVGNAQAQRDLGVSLDRIGDVKLQDGDTTGALAAYEEMLAIDRTLARDKGNAEAQRDLSVDLNKIGNVKLQAGDREGALAAYEESLKIRRDLAKDKGNAQAQTDLAYSLAEVASVAADPIPLYREALAILEGLDKEGRLSKEQQSWISWIKGRLGALPAATR